MAKSLKGGQKINDVVCGLGQYEIAIYDNEKGFYKVCKDINEARKELVLWRDKGTEKKDITVVNANPNVLFKDIFAAKSKTTVTSVSLDVSETKKTRSYKAIEVKSQDGTNKTYYLEMRMSVLRDIMYLSEAVLKEVNRRYDSTAVEVFIPDEIYEKVKKAKAKR